MSSPYDREPSQKEALVSPRGSTDGLIPSVPWNENETKRSRPAGYLRPCLAVSCLLNVFFLATLWYLVSGRDATSCLSDYAALPRNVVLPYNHMSPFGPHNKNETDRVLHWENLSTSGAQVALDKDWAREKGLPDSHDFPWDESKMVYSLRGFHTMHCIRKLHRWVTISHHNGTQIDKYPHVLHCLDTMLQNAFCEADDTPMYSDGSGWGNGQKRVCRNWDSLVEWSNDHHTCFLYINETQGVDSMWDRYKWCPKGSPYKDTVREFLGVKQGVDDEIPSEISSLPHYWEDF